MSKELFRDDSAKKIYDESLIRRNIIEWYPFENNTKALCIGCPTAVVDFLEKYGVDAIKVKNGSDLNVLNESMYDYVIYLNGQEINLTRDVELNLETLKKLRNLMKNDGKMFIATNNKLSVQSLAGKAELHSGKAFWNFRKENDGADTYSFTKKELEKLITDCGFSNYVFYYPVPDFSFPTQIYSDDFLPHKGDFYDEGVRLFENDLKTFDESVALDQICEEGLFTELTNSYLVVVEK